MRIVRTVGQAFEVCHKFNLHKNSLEPNDERSDISSSELLDVEQISEQQLSEDGERGGGDNETPKKGECRLEGRGKIIHTAREMGKNGKKIHVGSLPGQ